MNEAKRSNKHVYGRIKKKLNAGEEPMGV